MFQLMFEKYKVMTLGMLIDAIQVCLDSKYDVQLDTTFVYDTLTEVCDVTVDGNHLGTVVSLEWVIEKFGGSDVQGEMWMEYAIPHVAWRECIAKLHDVWQMTPDPNAWCVLVTD
jgi:hypothetical protein